MDLLIEDQKQINKALHLSTISATCKLKTTIKIEEVKSFKINWQN